MADRCSASIVLGGTLAPEHVPALVQAVHDEGLATDYEAADFSLGDIVSGEPLFLCAHEVSWGTFNILEEFCRAHKLAYSRWFGACPGVWGCGRSVYRGEAEIREGSYALDEYDASEDDHILMGEQLARQLGSFEAILEHFAAAEFFVPPLTITAAVDPQTQAIAAPV